MSTEVIIIPTNDTSWGVDDKYDIKSKDLKTVLHENNEAHFYLRSVSKQNPHFIKRKGDNNYGNIDCRKSKTNG